MSLPDEIRRFVAGAEHTEAELASLARAAFAYQYERLPAYRALCERAGRTPGNIDSWDDVPLVPAAAFATVELATDPPRETFRSSGTLGGERSVHRHPFPDLYRATVDASFPRFCLTPGEHPPTLSLVAPRQVAPDSSLAFMAAHVLERFGGPGSAYGFGGRGIELGACRSWLGGRQRAGRPVLLFSTTFALAELVSRVERMNLHFRLPAGSVIFETGGFKARRRVVDRDELAAGVESWLGVPRERIVSEYGMTELTSQAYTETLAGGPADRFVTPGWMRVRALDPETLAPLPPGERGLLAFFDLANVGSAIHLLTEDLGRVDADGGFFLDGRAADAELRGCSLLAEELEGG